MAELSGKGTDKRPRGTPTGVPPRQQPKKLTGRSHLARRLASQRLRKLRLTGSHMKY